MKTVFIIIFLFSFNYSGFTQQDSIKKIEMEVSHVKTVHVIFSSAITYVDLGSRI